MNGDERCPGGFIDRALIGMIEMKNQAAVRADEIVVRHVGVVGQSLADQPRAQQRIAGGFAGHQGAEELGQLGKTGFFGAPDVRHKALADLQLIEAGGNGFFNRGGHGALLLRENGRMG